MANRIIQHPEDRSVGLRQAYLRLSATLRCTQPDGLMEHQVCSGVRLWHPDQPLSLLVDPRGMQRRYLVVGQRGRGGKTTAGYPPSRST